MFRFFICFILSGSVLWAEEKVNENTGPLAGHSYHGGAFNEGARQAARLMGGTGDIDFPITTTSKEAHKFFLQGVGQLHGFWNYESERSFRQVALLDPKCAIAYWGMALSANQVRGREFLAKAYEHLDGISKREKMFIDSCAAKLGLPTDEKGLAQYRKEKAKFKVKRSDKLRRGDYVKKLEEIILAYPDDLEAKAFLVITLYSNARGGHPINSHVAVNSLAQEILRKKPYHPTNHFVIHLWDRKKAAIALSAAAKNGQGSPSVAHMWHMPGHIYSKLGRYADAAWHQEASARTDHRHMMRDMVLPDRIHNFAHNNEWLSRNLMYLGRVEDAYSLVRNMCELPMHPKYNTFAKGSARYGRMRLMQLIKTYELWDRAISLEDTPYLSPTDIAAEQIRRLHLLGLAYYSRGNYEEGDKQSTQLQKLFLEVEAKAIKKYEDDEKKRLAAAKKKKLAKDKKVVAKGKAPVKDEKVIAKTKKPIKGKKVVGKKKKRSISKDEESAKESLLELRLVKALAQGDVSAIKKDDASLKGVDNWLKVQFYIAVKDFKKALEITKKDVEKNKNKVFYLSRHIYTLYQAGQKTDAMKFFDQLRAISQDVDLNTPLMTRLNAAADEFQYPEDWRLKHKVYKDIDLRPELASLGPFRWKPIKSTDWTLPGVSGENVSLSAINRDQATLVIFYLGAECLHCVEQLNAFAPMKEKYAKAGIKIVAISTEDVAGLKKSVSKYGDDGKFPFQIVSNEKLDIFKQYRCYDDFEKMPLHGTFLIDRNGYIRWQDISYEPFTKPEFLLKESIRLLHQPEDLIYGKK